MGPDLLTLTGDDLSLFESNGFLLFPRLIGASEVAELRDAYDAVLTGEIDVPGDRMMGGVTRQVMFPSRAADIFRRNAAISAASEIAGQLLGGEDIVNVLDMLIYKPPGHPFATPWHQDLAYARRPFAPSGTRAAFQTVQFWVALDDAEVDSGCMHFVPRHPGDPLLPHEVACGDQDDESRQLGIPDPASHLDLESAVACPVPAGGATAHAFDTPHYTPPNRSDRPRRAYIFTLARAGDPDAYATAVFP
jgi:ectoine hydroxylase-related dioxygenase (phytanoyl-CoA dioxygenase family)